MNEEMITREYGNASRLMESIREEAELRIGAIKEQTGREVQEAEKDFADEMRAYGEARERETDEAVGKAIFIMKNRAAIEKRKLQLNAVEDLIRDMVREGVADYIANNREGYLAFLKKTITGALSGIRGGHITIHLCPGDADLEKDIRDFIAAGKTGEGTLEFRTDETIAMGGVILEDREEGLLYNYSMERIIGRSYDTIRKEAVRIVQGHIKPPG